MYAELVHVNASTPPGSLSPCYLMVLTVLGHCVMSALIFRLSGSVSVCQQVCSGEVLLTRYSIPGAFPIWSCCIFPPEVIEEYKIALYSLKAV